MKIKLFFLYFFEFLRDGYYVGIFLLLPFISKDLHLNFFQVGSFQTVINVLAIVLAVPSTYFSAKLGGLKVLLFTLLLYAVGFLGISLSKSYSILLTLFFIMGIGFSFYTVISPHLITTWSRKESLGKELGNLMATGDVAKALFSVLIAFFVGLSGWRITSLWIGVTTGTLFLIFSFLYYKKIGSKEVNEDRIKKDVRPISYQYFLSQKKFALALLANALDMAVNIPLYAFLPFFLLYKGVPPIWLGIFTGFYYVGNIISRVVFGRLVDKKGNAKIFIFLEVTMAFVIFLLILSPTLLFTGFLALILGFITEGTDPATLSMVAMSLEPIQNSEKAYSIRAITNGITKTLSPLILGIVASKIGIQGTFYTLVFATLLPIIPAWMFMRIKKENNS